MIVALKIQALQNLNSLEENDSETDELCKSFDRSFSFVDDGLIVNRIQLDYFISHIPQWGGIINNDLIDITLKNTCSFDYFMLCLWVSTKFSDKIIESLNKTNRRK
jgi:hypothetical protein